MNIMEYKNRHIEMLNIFKTISNNIKENKEDLEIDDYYKFLISYFYDIYDKLSNNEWHNYSDLIFIDKFNKLIYEDKLFQCIYQLEYVRLYNILKDKFINLSIENIKLLLCVPYDFQDLTIQEYNKIIKYLSNFFIKNDINSETSFKNKVNKLIDCVDCMRKGYDPVSILFEEKEEIENLNVGIITIDRIYEYYIDQAYRLRDLTNNLPSEEVISNIQKIKQIDKKYYNKFVELVRFCDFISENLIENLNNMSSIVEIFMRFSKIDEVDIDELKRLLSYKIVNNYNIQELEELYERKIK